MAVAVHISPQKMSRDDYERVIKDLEDSGDGDPDGRAFHAAYDDDEVRIFEVWDSPEDLESHRDRYFAALQASGVDAGSVDIHPVHSLPD
jgi:hypothetical protein